MLGLPAGIFGLLRLIGAPSPVVVFVTLAVAIGAWCGAWLLWSWLVVRWRLWAYRRVKDLDELKRLAVEAQVIWPEGHPFQRTELRSGAIREELARLEARAAEREKPEA